MTQVKAGVNYVYNPRNGAVYVASPDVLRVGGVVPFSPAADGDFTKDMLTTQAEETSVEAEVYKLVEASAPPSKAKPALSYKQQVEQAAKALVHMQTPRSTLAPTEDPTK